MRVLCSGGGWEMSTNALASLVLCGGAVGICVTDIEAGVKAGRASVVGAAVCSAHALVAAIW